MRAVELAKVAAAAEALRLRRIARRQGTRAAFGAVAGAFAVAVIVLLHVVAYQLLVRNLAPVQSSLILLAFDLVVAGACAYLAMSNKPDAIETEAKVIRHQAIVELKRSLTVMAVAGEAANLILRSRRRKAGASTRPRSAVRLFAEVAARLLAWR